MQDNMHQYTYAFADVLILELILRPVSSFYQCRLSCCVYVDCFTLVSCPCLFELTLSLIWSLPHWTMSCAMKNKVHKHTWTFFAVCSVHQYLDIWAPFELFRAVFWALTFCYQCKLSCCLYILHIPWCPRHVRLSSFWAWFWAFPTGIWAVPNTNIHVPVLMFSITTTIFALILSPVLSFYQLDFSCCLYILHLPWCSMSVCLGSFWAWTWAFPTGIRAIPCRTKYINIRVPSLMLFISTWILKLALSWTFTNVIWAAGCTSCKYLGVLWVPVWARFERVPCKTTYIDIRVPALVFFIATEIFELILRPVLSFYQCHLICFLKHFCLSSFWAWFWAFPTGIWAVPCKTTYIGIRVPLLCWYLSSFCSFLRSYPCDSSCCLYILHIPWCRRHFFELFLSLILSLPHWNLSCPVQNNIHKHTCSFLDLFHRYMDIEAPSGLCLELLPTRFELPPVHPTNTLVYYECLFDLVSCLNLGLLHWNLSCTMQTKCINTSVPSLMFFIRTWIFELISSSA